MGSYISIITLKVNWLNAPTKDKDWSNGYKNKTPIKSLQMVIAAMKLKDAYSLEGKLGPI